MIPAKFLLVALVAAGVLVAGCTQAPTPAAPPASPAGTAMEKKEGAMMEKKNETAMKKEGGAMMEKKNESGAMMEKKEGAMMEKKNESGAMMEKKEGAMATLPTQLKSPHFTDSSPAHGETFARVPTRVVLNFNFDLHPNSALKITKDGTNATGGATVVGADRLNLTAPVKDLGNGTYVVDYTACWPDGSCHPGRFAFTVDGGTLAGFQDLRNKSSVTVSMQGIAFAPQKIRISAGTKVTFVNNDPVEHFVNSDPHPSHNYLPSLNSRGLAEGKTYEYTFAEKGEVHYHCSAHVLGLARPMTATIIVE